MIPEQIKKLTGALNELVVAHETMAASIERVSRQLRDLWQKGRHFSASVDPREAEIVGLAIDGLMGAGYEIAVHDGERRSPFYSDRRWVEEEIGHTEQNGLYCRRGQDVWHVQLKFGAGCDVISLYTAALEGALQPALSRAAALAKQNACRDCGGALPADEADCTLCEACDDAAERRAGR